MSLPIELLTPEQKAGKWNAQCPAYCSTKLPEYSEVFASFDKNGDGTISNSELGEAMQALGRHLTPAQLQRIIKEVDVNGNGSIDFDEFLVIMAKADGEEEMMQMFREFDKSGDGRINSEELKAIMQVVGEKLTEGQIEEMIRAADIDGDKQIDYEEFRKMVLSK